MSYEVKDKKGRILLHISKKGKLALSRFPDLSEKEINGLIEIYHDLDPSSNPKDIESFLRFEENNEKFCS